MIATHAMLTATRRRTLACEHGGPSPLRLPEAVRVSMPYEATVPVHRRLLWPAVTDAERLIGALPNASIDASGAQGVAGRLRVRTREQTVTFRGVARIVEVVPASLRISLEVEAVFGRAGGTVEGVVEIALRQSGPGTRVVVGGQLDISPGSAPLSVEALDSAFQRVVQRWFTALAETSPAAKPAAQERSERRELPDSPPEAQATEPQPDTELPRRRSSKRAPLAVVRDLPAGQQKPGNGSSAPAQPDQPAEPEPQDSSPSNGWSKPPQQETAEDAADEAQAAEAPAPLRLVTPESEAAPDPDEPSEPEPPETVGEQAALATEDAALSVEPEPDDIWSRLRDRSLPPWIPFLVGAATATLAALAFVLAALRRHYRR
ncbi:MAG TPA: hypothetical protein VFB40_12075 [Actinocrinis sp.]|nr:hypothetical protein [Actinocrinis sp.]